MSHPIRRCTDVCGDKHMMILRIDKRSGLVTIRGGEREMEYGGRFEGRGPHYQWEIFRGLTATAHYYTSFDK